MPLQALAALSPGFADPVFDSQAVFRAVMWALARPGSVELLGVDLSPPAPLSKETAAVVLALADFETPLWLDPALAAAPEVGAYLRFHTGAAIVTDPGAARFALISNSLEMTDFSVFPQGTPDYPDNSATLIVQVERLLCAGFRLEGPGVRNTRLFGAEPLPSDLPARWAANRARFPLGIDLILTAPDSVAALPRSVVLVEG